MCELCAGTATFDPTRHPGGGSFATIFEDTDAPSSTATPYTISVGDTFVGSIDPYGDLDVVGINLVAGQTYTITVNASGSDPISDSVVSIYNSSGTFLDSDDDGGTGLYSSLTFTAGYTGTHYLGASGYSVATGGYAMSVTTAGSPPPPPPPGDSVGTLDELADFLTGGYWQGTGRSARSYDTSSDNQITVNISGLTSAGQQLALWAMEAWELVTDLDFVQVSGSANITFDDNDSGAYASSTVSGGTILSGVVNVSTNWLSVYGTTIDSYSFQTYVHEIGHAIGLGHQGGYNGSATYGTDETFSNDSWQISIMSYFNQTDNTTTSASYARLLTPMMADVLAVHNLYGQSTATAGNTTWGANSNLGGYIQAVFMEMAGQGSTSIYNGGGMAFTITDTGGHDTLDLSFLTSGANVSLVEETFSDVGGLTGNMAIARGTLIEDVITGSGGDTIQGNYTGNSINSGGGNDSVDGGAGFDSILGGIGNDTLNGDGGNDTIRGESGADLIAGGTGDDALWGAAENDTLYGGSNNDVMGGGADNDVLWAGDGNDSLYGGTGNDTLNGESGTNALWGMGGNDVINASDNGDRIGGGGGMDTINGGSGNDTVYGGIYAGETTIYGNGGNDEIYGSIDNDTIFGGSGNDNIGGNLGNDRIVAGTGNDTVRGFDGTDTFVFLNNHDLLTIEDFDFAESDRLELDDALWGGGLSASQMLATYGNVSGGNLVLDFGGGDVVTLLGVTNTSQLASYIDIV